MRNHVKTCSGCNRHLWVAAPSSLEIIPRGYKQVAFNRKTGTSDGLQPWCRTCDWNGKATINEAWNTLRRFLEEREPQSLSRWTKDLYLQIVGDDPHCQWCGARCREWGIGHWLDRQSSKSGHIPSNCVPCCSPCNFHKGHKTYANHAAYLRSLLIACPQFPQGQGAHPWGKIPWDDYESSSKRFERKMPPDLSEHVVHSPQLSLFDLGAAP